MLLTLVTRSLTGLAPALNSNGEASLLDLPPYVMQHLQLRGMNVPASQLVGWGLQDLDHLRDRADKAGCPCLVLVEDTPLDLGSASADARNSASERVRVLAVAAHRLGCNSISIACTGPDDSDDTFDRAAAAVKAVMPEVERLELNMLLEPCAGFTHTPERLTDLIKRIGGFRIGSLPSFGHAASTDDPIAALRKLAPYAGAVHATIESFDKSGKHTPYDLAAFVQAIRSVGYVNTLAIDYASNKNASEVIEQARTVLQAAIDEPS